MAITDLIETRRRFMTHFAGIGLGTTLAPGMLWARMQDAGARTRDARNGHRCAAAVRHRSVRGRPQGDGRESPTATSRSSRISARFDIPNDVSPPFHFSTHRPGHRGQQDQAAIPPERGAGRQAASQPRGRRLLAGAPSRRAAPHAAGHVARADRDVSDAAAPLQRRSSTTSSPSSTITGAPKRSAPTPRSRPAATRGRCTAFRGAPRTSSRSRASRRPGDRPRSRSRSSTTTRAWSRCCAKPARC